MLLPTIADSLAGRMETLTLLPLSQSEIEKQPGNWIDRLFAEQIPMLSTAVIGSALLDRVLRGGYPEVISRDNPKRRTAWANQYIDALIQRDVQDIANIDKLSQLPRFLRALANTAGQMSNYTQLGGNVGLDSKTAARYVGILEQVYLLKRIDVWARNRLNRVVKTPKLQFLDSGLLAAQLNLTAEEIQLDRTRFGSLLETFVYSELLKLASHAETDCKLMYYRDADQYEVDIVIEHPNGQIIGVEVKAAATVQERDLRGLKKLANLAAQDFKMGVILYDGDETLPLGNSFWAMPVSSLWSHV